MIAWLQRLWNTIRPGRLERDIQRELAFHIAERTDQLRAEGLSEAEAARHARARFGNITLQRERTRDVSISLLFDRLQRDLRHAVRALRRTPAFTVTAVSTLALGIGANAVVFSAIDAVLLRPLPFPDGDRLMELRQRQDGTAETNIAPVRLEEWHAMNRTFTALTGHYMEDVSETSGDYPDRVKRALVAPRFLDVWGIAPAIGRGFTDAEHHFGGPAAIMVSHRYWRTRLGGDPNPLGRTVRVGSRAIPVVGVMPDSFKFPDRGVDLWSPVAVDAPFAQSRSATWYVGIGRLRPGVTVQQARANLDAVQSQLAAEHPQTDAAISAMVTPLKERTVGEAGASLWLLFGGVSILLLITCTNVAALVLSRATQRRHELSVRVSLGASRLAVAGQVFVETVVIAVAGSALGLVLAHAGVATLRAAAVDLPRADEIAVDWRVALYALVTAGVVALLCGLLPAVRAASEHAHPSLQSGGRGLVSSRSSWQWWLVGGQVTLSVLLLACAGLLLRSLQALWQTDAGFSVNHVLAFRMSGSWSETSDRGALLRRMDATLERLRAMPGVESAAVTGWSLPGVPAQFEMVFALAEAQRDADRRMAAEGRAVSPEYFATMRIPLVAGEVCRQHPTTSATSVAREVMVNRAFVERYLAGRQPLGLHLTIADAPPDRIVGIVGDARERGLDRVPGPTVYWCDSAPNPTPYFVVRTQSEMGAAAQAIRVAMKELHPLRAVYELGPLEERIGGAFAQNRLRTGLLALYAMAALLLTCVGIHGTLSYAVSTRRREIGVRLAFGARRRQVVAQLLTECWRMVIIASICGIAVTLAAGRLLAGMLYGISATDPVTLSAAIAIVLAVATLAAFLPAARAARFDPAKVLREA